MKYYVLIVLFILLAVTGCKKEVKEVIEVDEVELEEVEEKKVEIVKNQKLTNEQQILSAVKAAPMVMRDLATVYGYDEQGEFVLLRQGSNSMICVADDPNRDGFEVVAYHKSLDPFMARGRELTKEGKNREEKEKIREEEAITNVLQMPEVPAALHIYFGKNGYYDIDDNEVRNCRYRYVVYTPFATAETTGLGLQPNKEGHPWLMFPGKYNAHIMISPQD
ncbi:hypothetical protein [Namhaeicola litoreus]|uniref:Uncharacterized protein n=1 Tax=Namhaeicola litoreus TaxID=1052145 RepID=A0ABW3Y404_9FLAO